MPNHPLIVLKFGGSVLLDEERLKVAVHEIYRWRREGWRVVAAVSALAGRTDELGVACQRLSPRASRYASSALLSTGEAESAALLGLHLDRVGLPARVLTPGAVQFKAQGDPLNADPVAISTAFFESALSDDEVVVFPGYTALDDHGRLVTLGRGGSDTTALFLAHALGAERCRLIKDVDGLYESDPAQPGPIPKRFRHCSYQDALQTDGSIIQHKAVRLAQRHTVEFELGRFNGIRPTRIGGASSQYDNARDTSRPLRVSLAGAGTVGGGVLELLEQLPHMFEIESVSCRTSHRQDELRNRGHAVYDDPFEAQRNADVVIELIGGVDTATNLIRQNLRSGRHVVTANKAVLAQHGEELHELAVRNNCVLLAAASVGGGLPVLERAAATKLRAVRGVLNGTSNFVLEKMRAGYCFEKATEEAQLRGLAEADPSRDLSGQDSIDKLTVIAQVAGLGDSCSGLTRVGIEQGVYENREQDDRFRHVASLDNSEISVRVRSVPKDDPLYHLPGEMNAVELVRQDGAREVIRGKGAGRWPTAESVLGDLLELSRKLSGRAQLGSSENESQADRGPCCADA